MHTLAKFGTVVGAAIMLAGCQSSPFAGWGFAKSSSKRAEARPTPEIVGAQLIEEGRALLAQGRISAAVATFRLARLDAGTAAQAENGLGVAYAKLGRYDLAERYFRSAVEREPADMRFTANLLRLQRQVLFARSQARPSAPQLAQAEPVPHEVASTAPPVHRLSDGMVRITTREELGARPQMAIAFVERPAKVELPEEPDSVGADMPDAKLALADDKAKQKLIVIPK